MEGVVELHNFFAFDCDECGTENFIRPVKGEIEIADEQQRHLMVAKKDGPINVMVTLAPMAVRCCECGATFRTKVCGELEEHLD